MKKIITIFSIMIASLTLHSNSAIHTSIRNHLNTDTAAIKQRYLDNDTGGDEYTGLNAPCYYMVYATVTEVDTANWTAYCTDFSGHVYTFEVLDEYNAGDNIRALVCNNGTLSANDDYIIEVHYYGTASGGSNEK